jgi:hypothetical protein
VSHLGRSVCHGSPFLHWLPSLSVQQLHQGPALRDVHRWLLRQRHVRWQLRPVRLQWPRKLPSLDWGLLLVSIPILVPSLPLLLCFALTLCCVVVVNYSQHWQYARTAL